MSTFKNFTVQDFQQKQTPANTSRNAGQYFINDAELSHDSYENTNDSYSDTSFESQRRLFRPQAPQVKPNNCKAQGGRPRTEIWDYFQSGKLGSAGHYRARCYYCSREWSKGEPTKLEIHLGYECAKCPKNIREYWVTKIIDKQNNYQRTPATKRKKMDSTQTNITNHFKSDEPLPLAEQNSLDQAVLKAWVAAGIPFSVIENPFVIDLFMRLNPGYIPPSQATLGRILNEEAIKIKDQPNF